MMARWAVYPVVIINWVQYLGPPVPFSFPDSQDLLEVLVATHVKPSELPGKETRKQATLLASLPALL